MTPAELHAAIVARVQARLELARAAIYDNTTGHWSVSNEDPHTWIHPAIVSEGVRLLHGAAACMDHAAANDPAFTIRMCTAALERLEEHRPVRTEQWRAFPQLDGLLVDYACSHSWGPGIVVGAVSWTDCPEVRREAAVWGVEVDGDG